MMRTPVIGVTEMVGGRVGRGLLANGKVVHVLIRSADPTDVLPLEGSGII